MIYMSDFDYKTRPGRRQGLLEIQEVLPHIPLDIERAMKDDRYYQDYLLLAIPLTYKAAKKTLKKVFKYAVTYTDGFEKDPKVLLERAKTVLEIEGVFKVQGVIELTEAGFPHLHFTVSSNNYVNKKQLISRNKKRHVVVKKIKGEKGWNNYMDKDAKDEKLLTFLKKYGIEKSDFLYIDG